jgi:CDP-diacylglycerol--glycerol-3-phosphate 3-phosphatidyltransferase
MARHIKGQTPLSQLRLRWAATALLWALCLALGWLVLYAFWQSHYPLQWLLQASVGGIYLLWVLWRSLAYNHRLGETSLLPAFGAGNTVTLLRGVLVSALFGFLFMPWPQGWLAWLPAAFYTLATLADFVDGYLARRTNHATRLGEILDINIDALGILVASLLAIQYGQVPIWYLLVALARYLFLAGIWLRRMMNKPVFDLQPSVRRRAFAGVQMGFLFFILMPVFSPPGTHIAAALFALPFLVGFLVDWLAVSGIIDPKSSKRTTNGQLFSATKSFVLNWLPVVLRLVAAVLFAYQLVQVFMPYSGSNGMQLGGILQSSNKLLPLVLAQATASG